MMSEEAIRAKRDDFERMVDNLPADYPVVGQAVLGAILGTLDGILEGKL